MNWFKTSTRNDESWLLLYTLSAIFASTWCAWLCMKKSRNKIPPLPPGPLGMPLLGNLLSLDPELHSYFARLAHTYGPIFKLRLGAMTCVVINSPSSAREVLKDRDVTFANRDVPVAARIAFYGGADVVWTPHGPEWRMLRKVSILKMLGGAALDSFQSIRQNQVRKTVRYLYGRAGSPVNVGEQIFLTSLNVISNMICGGCIAAEDGEERAGLGAEFRKVVSEITGLIGRPNVSDFFPGLGQFDLQGIKKQMEGLVRRFDGIFEQMIDRRLKMEEEGAKESQGFLTFLLKLKEEGGDSKTPLTMTHLKALLMVCELLDIEFI
ncbi:PREDICTED: cytochrome P450 76M5-like [Prunus mume]|uniref:Cytochrome P450 76M5-like n=1 Tax=Prunus mume TaxID=102107 RepID=A0ABM0PF15_PRUMU|nr:PREDICTED: cytochrome P450 76M5-like [Prunus mume]